MNYDNCTTTGDYSNYGVLEEEQEPISLNDIFWVKVKNSIWQGRLIKTPYSVKEEDSKKLKIKWVDSRK